jgi:hypothetical protein
MAEPQRDPGVDRLAVARGRRTDLRLALGRLEQAVSTAATGRETEWAQTVMTRIDELTGALSQHLEGTEAPGGLFEEVLELAPRLAHAIDKLRDDHERITEHAAAVRDGAAAVAAGDGGVEALRSRAVELMVEVVEHRHHGADLVYSAYNVDIEAAD